MAYLLLLIASFFLAFYFTAWDRKKWRWESATLVNFSFPRNGFEVTLTVGNITAIVSIFVFIAAFLSPIYWEFPSSSGRTALVDKNNTIIDSSGFFGVKDFWWGDNKVINISLSNYKGEVAVSPVSANPKVRHIVSHVWARIVDPQAYLNGVSGANASSWSDVGARVFTRHINSSIYEFHEKNSVELGKLYNPLDQKQQAKFYELVVSAMSDEFAKRGIQIVGAEFSM